MYFPVKMESGAKAAAQITLTRTLLRMLYTKQEFLISDLPDWSRNHLGTLLKILIQ